MQFYGEYSMIFPEVETYTSNSKIFITSYVLVLTIPPSFSILKTREAKGWKGIVSDIGIV